MQQSRCGSDRGVIFTKPALTAATCGYAEKLVGFSLPKARARAQKRSTLTQQRWRARALGEFSAKLSYARARFSARGAN